MKYQALFCLPAASAATCWVLKTSGSRVAVSSERYSIRSLPVRTHLGMTVGGEPSVNSLQIGHSRSPKYSSVTGAVGEPSTLALWGMPPMRLLTAVVVDVISDLLLASPDLDLPPVAISTMTITTTTTATTTQS